MHIKGAGWMNTLSCGKKGDWLHGNKYADKKIVCIHMSDGARERALNLDVRNVIVPEDGTVINL